MAIRQPLSSTRLVVCASTDDAVDSAHGLVNATPVGMHGHPGSAFERDLIMGKQWLFDAVYTPVETRLIKHAATARAAAISGYELFFYQGLSAFALFSGRQVDETTLRNALAVPDDGNSTLSRP